MNEINEIELRKALALLNPDGKLFEIRLMRKQPKQTISGYFKDIDTAVEGLKKLDLRGFNCYITLNEIKDECYSRLQRDKFRIPESTTSDTDITHYDWLFIDLDPVRVSEVSSSNEELEQAHALAKKVYGYLKQRGFEDPLVAMSGNGFHLLYRIQLTNTPESKSIIERCLKALALMFNTDGVKIDTVNSNPARICKLYGTLAQKGSGTEERPHRMAHIVRIPEQLLFTKKVYLEEIADQLPKPEKPQHYNNFSPAQFDIRDWMSKHGISYKEKAAGDYTKFILDECPFDSSHKAPDSMITIGGSGAIGFRCLHNSCHEKTWKDVRIKYEPDAYDHTADDERIQAGWNQHKLFNRQKNINYNDPIDDSKVFQTAMQIFDSPEETEDYIRTGIDGIDNRMRGFKKGYVTLLSGLRGGAKSTLLTTFALNAVQDGNNVIAYSGELTAKNFMRWMNLQAAGKNYTKPSQWDDYYYVESDIQKKIAEWLGNHFLLYNNDYGRDYKWIRERIEREIESQKTDLLILDNLMALNIKGLDPEKYAAQTQFITDLQMLAKKTMVHIIFVAHPRKSQGFLRLDDVSGTADLANLTDNAFIVHRNNNDFQRLTKEMFKWKEDNPAYSGTNVIEITKDRDLGTQDVFIPLWYEKETKRLKNAPAEMIYYGWDSNGGWETADLGEIPF